MQSGIGFNVRNMAPGTWKVRVSKPGYKARETEVSNRWWTCFLFYHGLRGLTQIKNTENLCTICENLSRGLGICGEPAFFFYHGLNLWWIPYSITNLWAVFIKTTLPAKICASAALRLCDFARNQMVLQYENCGNEHISVFAQRRQGAKNPAFFFYHDPEASGRINTD